MKLYNKIRVYGKQNIKKYSNLPTNQNQKKKQLTNIQTDYFLASNNPTKVSINF